MVRAAHVTALAVLVVAIAVVAKVAWSSTILRRLVRNVALPDDPERLQPAYPTCPDVELIGAVTLVVTVKDTCAQAQLHLEHLASMYPKEMEVIYAYPGIRGCRHVPVDDIGRRLFKHWTSIEIGRSDAPIVGFLRAQKILKTKYAVLMHNDAFPMEADFACEMYRALEAHPEYPIAAPQIYEMGDTGILVPHGHHENLHVRPAPGGVGHKIDFDLSFDLLTQREVADFREGPQVDFLEDHAFFARSDIYHELLDEGGSFTMEYMDMILNMRARNTSAWFVPTARCYFAVHLSRLSWEDMPYFSYKRSEQIGHQVRTYLTNKWGVAFPNTGIWTFIRYVFLDETVLEGAALPDEWDNQAALFYTWFESVGFNRYDGQYFPDFIETPSPFTVNVSRTMKHELPNEVPLHRVPPQSAMDILPLQAKKSMGKPEIAFDDPHVKIALKKRTCTLEEPSSYAECGLAFADGDSCNCWNYVPLYNTKTTLYMDKLMDLLKLPSRAFMFAQMKLFVRKVDEEDVDFFCGAHQEECQLQVQFPVSATLLQWSWHGKQPKVLYTSEGLRIVSTMAGLLMLPLIFVFKSTLRSVKGSSAKMHMCSSTGVCG